MNSIAWLLVLLFASNFITNFAHENPQTIPSNELTMSDLQKHGRNTEGQLKLYADSDGRKLMASENITSAEKAQRGKGSYGGANVVHRRPSEKGAAALCRPYFFISSAVLGFSFYLLLAFPFQL